jgi:carboxyl-terminal processing protease
MPRAPGRSSARSFSGSSRWGRCVPVLSSPGSDPREDPLSRVGRILVCLAALLASRFAFAQQPAATPVGPTDDEFRALVDLVQKTYFREEPREKLLGSARDGMFRGLDPYSRYLTPDEWVYLKRGLAAEFGGIGIHYTLNDGAHRPRVLHLFPGSAAGDAGIVPGDLLFAIDDISTEGMSFDNLIYRLPGEVGSTVRLSVLHAGASHPVEYRVVRRRLKTPSVRPGRRDGRGVWSEFMYDARWRIGYVRIANLASDTVGLLEAALQSLTSRGMRGLLLDLRDDAGGLLSAAVGAADLFIDSGRIISEVGRDGVEEIHDATPGGYEGFPMVVLVNQATASAAEVLAAALQDSGRAKVIGERTFGKALVQELFPLGAGDRGIRLTVAEYRRPSGENIDRFTAPKGSDRWGVCPDTGLDVFLAPADYATWSDAFLSQGWSYLPTPLELATQGPVDERDDVLQRAVELLRSEIVKEPDGGRRGPRR